MIIHQPYYIHVSDLLWISINKSGQNDILNRNIMVGPNLNPYPDSNSDLEMFDWAHNFLISGPIVFSHGTNEQTNKQTNK